MFYEHYHFGGMHIIWWFVWIVFLVLLFGTSWNVPWVRKKGNSAMDILQQRFASGQITNEEYQEKKKILEHDNPKK